MDAGFKLDLPDQIVESQFGMQIGSIATDMNAGQDDLRITGGNQLSNLLQNLIGAR